MSKGAGFEIDLRGYGRALNSTVGDIQKASRKGLTAAMNEWKRDAIDVAPLDSSTLRRSITFKTTDATGSLNVDGVMRANAIEKRGGSRFNYGYYIHEVKPDQSFKAPGAIGTFLSTPLEQNDEEYIRIIDDMIRAGISSVWR